MKTKVLLFFLSVGLIISCTEQNETKPIYDIKKFQGVLLNSAKKINELKSKSQGSRSANGPEGPTIEGADAEAIIQPLMEESRLLIESYDINLLEEFGSYDNPDIVAGALSIYRLEMLIASGATIEQINAELDAQSTYASNSDLFDCALQAAGVTILIELGRGGARYLSKQLAIKAIKKVAARVLGPIGAAWAAYEFGDCMGWW